MISIASQESSCECILSEVNPAQKRMLHRKYCFLLKVNSKKYYKILFLNEVHHKIQLIYNYNFQKATEYS